jgi:hypothetical protein
MQTRITRKSIAPEVAAWMKVCDKMFDVSHTFEIFICFNAPSGRGFYVYNGAGGWQHAPRNANSHFDIHPRRVPAGITLDEGVTPVVLESDPMWHALLAAWEQEMGISHVWTKPD